MATAADHIIALVQDCVVYVEGQGCKGAGFFCAPGIVLTCAHVVGAPENPVKVVWPGGSGETPLRGTVRWASRTQRRDPGLAPYPDLALVQLAEHDLPHPVALLEDQPCFWEARFAVAGFASLPGLGREATTRFFHHDGSFGEMIQLGGAEVAGGMSGAPVLNLDTGRVCGVVKLTFREGLPVGGCAIPLRGIRLILDQHVNEYRAIWSGHDEYHRRDRRWSTLASGRSGSAQDPDRVDESELTAALARLPAADPATHLRAYQEVAGLAGTEPRHPLLDHRDVVVELASLVPRRRGELPRTVEYAAHLARTTSDQSTRLLLRDWALRVGERLGHCETVEQWFDGLPPAVVEPSIMVCIRPVPNGRDRFRYQILRYRGPSEATKIYQSPRSEPLARIIEHLRRRLPALVDENTDGKYPTMVELIVPLDLLDTAIDEWPDNPDLADWMTLGIERPVIVRDLERFVRTGEPSWRWRQRWEDLDGKDLGSALHPVCCTDRVDASVMYGRLTIDGAPATLVLPGSPKHEPAHTAARIGLGVGVPMMIWRRDGCRGVATDQHPDCPGVQLLAGLRTALRRIAMADLPAKIRSLRSEIAAAGTSGHWAQQIVLLWDDPWRRPAHRMLAEPQKGRRTDG